MFNEDLQECIERSSLFNIDSLDEIPFNCFIEEKLGSKTQHDSMKNDQNVEVRRRLGKERSKKARDKKKLYLQELEVRVKELEKDNIRLQNLIEIYKANGADELIPKDQK